MLWEIVLNGSSGQGWLTLNSREGGEGEEEEELYRYSYNLCSELARYITLSMWGIQIFKLFLSRKISKSNLIRF